MNHDFHDRLDNLESESEGGDDFSLIILQQDTNGETIEDWGR